MLVPRDGSRYEVNVSGRGWATAAQRGQRGQHRSALQPVPGHRRGPAESDRRAQRKVRKALVYEYVSRQCQVTAG
jgi:hypothetical protein